MNDPVYIPINFDQTAPSSMPLYQTCKKCKHETKKCMKYTGPILSNFGTLSGANLTDLLWKHSGFFQTDANKQESQCCAHNSDVGNADLEGAARTRAVAWPAWFWDRWSRKESAGSPSRLAFSGSARTWPGNDAWSSTLKWCSLGNAARRESCDLWITMTHSCSLLCVIYALPRGVRSLIPPINNWVLFFSFKWVKCQFSWYLMSSIYN